MPVDVYKNIVPLPQCLRHEHLLPFLRAPASKPYRPFIWYSLTKRVYVVGRQMIEDTVQHAEVHVFTREREQITAAFTLYKKRVADYLHDLEVSTTRMTYNNTHLEELFGFLPENAEADMALLDYCEHSEDIDYLLENPDA
jgi:hypothetical protein